MKIKRTLSALLALLIIFTAIPQLAFATDGDLSGDGNAGSGQADGSTDSASTWNTSQQGYRFVIADQSLNPVSNVVDICFSDPRNKAGEVYFNSRATSLSTDNSNYYLQTATWSQIVATTANLPPENKIDTPPPAAIGWTSDNSAIAQGLAFKDWFMGTDDYVGGRVPDVTPDNPNYVENPSNPGGVTPPPSGGTGGSGDNKPNSDKLAIDRIISAASTRMYKEAQAMFKFMTDVKMKAVDGLYTRYQCIGYINFLISNYTSSALISKLNKIYGDIARELDADYGSSDYATYMRIQLVSLKTTMDTISTAFAPAIDERRLETIAILRAAMLSGNGKSALTIPLADKEEGAGDSGDTSNPKSHYMQVLNMLRADGSPLFQISGFTPTQEHTTVTEIKEKNYVVLVEPILWFKPTGANSSGGINPNDVYSKYVYGTIANMAEWYKANNNNTKYGGSGRGGWFASILGEAGWQCMLSETDWVGDGTSKLLALTGTGIKNKITIANMQSKLANHESLAIHIYTANDLAGIFPDSTQTFDPTSPDPEHPAPIPPAPQVPSDPDNGGTPDEGDTPDDGGTPANPADPSTPAPYKINIIKFYEENSLPVSNHTRNQNPSSIKIMDEPTGNYVVDAWVISPNYINPSSQSDTYSDTISNISVTSDGTSPTTVNVTTPNTTLYVKLIKSDGNTPIGSINDLLIRESQVTKSVATMDKITTDKGAQWGPRDWEYVYGSMSGSHTRWCVQGLV